LLIGHIEVLLKENHNHQYHLHGPLEHMLVMLQWQKEEKLAQSVIKLNMKLITGPIELYPKLNTETTPTDFLKSTHSIQRALFLKELIINTMVFSNSKNH